jgi:hypothetical protein
MMPKIYFSADLDDYCYIVEGDQNLYRGVNITLTCHANGYPAPLYSWHLQGHQVATSSRIRIQENQLDIFNATMNDSGEYLCVAYNPIGNVSRKVTVTVRGW